METSKLRFILAIIIIGGFLSLLAIVILATIFVGFDQDFGLNIIEEVSKVMAGFVGLIIGYYFSRGQTTATGDAGPAAGTEAGPGGASPTIPAATDGGTGGASPSAS